MTELSKPTFLLQLAAELRGSARRGATLAALTFAASCGGESKDEPPAHGGSTGSGGTSGGASHTGGGGTTGGGGATGGDANLQPYPTTGIGCFGPVHDGGYYGQCCYDVRCYSPENGTCSSASDPTSELFELLPPGSGSCSCRENGEAYVNGPYAPNPTHTPSSEGSCCYLVGAIECEGRPFFVDGELLLADLMVRSDWGLAA